MACKDNVSNIGPIMQLQNSSAFLIVLTFACQALIACAKQLDIMDGECGDGNYGTILAQSANAIKLAIEVMQWMKLSIYESFFFINNYKYSYA